MANSGLSGHNSPALEAATKVLTFLEVTEPPITHQLVLNGLDFQTRKIPDFDIERLSPQQRRRFASVRGLLCPVDRTIFVAEDLPFRRLPWLIYHETGHATIEWHRELLFLDTDYTLSERVREIMEREANEFAAHIQFLGARFVAEAQELPFGAASVFYLASRYGASIEATARRYAESSDESCVCLVLEPTRSSDGEETLKYRYFARSGKIRWRFPITIGECLPSEHPAVAHLLGGKLKDGRIIEDEFFDSTKGDRYRNEIFSNGLSVFILIQLLR